MSADRVELRTITAADARAIQHGPRADFWHRDFPREDDVDGASMTPSDADESFVWGSRHILLDGTAVGSVGFFGPPSPAPTDEASEAEVGFGLVEDARGRGVAARALRLLLVEADAAGVRLRASVEPTNRPSLRLLSACGFTDLRGTDEEGHLVMVRPLPAP